MKRFIGVDLHKNRFTVCYFINDDAYTVETFSVSSSGIINFVETLKETDEVAVEATGNAGYFIREIEDSVSCVKVINPSQFKVISSSVKKTDAEDAITIAKYLSKGLLPEVRMRSKKESQLASLIGTRDKLVKLRTVLKNKIHNILNMHGVVTKREAYSSEKELRAVLRREELDSDSLFELRIIVDQIINLNKSIDEISRELTDRGKKLGGHKNLKSITGIGDISATILLNTIGDVYDFYSEKRLGAYLGIVPRVQVSNETSHYGRITKRGNKIARTALVQSTLIAIRYNPYLRSFYHKIKSKKGSGKAIIATSRKMLTIIYRTLKNDWVFEDFNNYVLAVNT